MAPRHKKDTDLVTIYILKCKEKKWYVGKTSKYGATKRIVQHFANIGGSNWTRRYKPIKVDDVKKIKPLETRINGRKYIWTGMEWKTCVAVRTVN